MDVPVVADGLEDAGRERPVELERELLGIDVCQHVGQEARVERDRRPVAFDRRFDPANVIADLGVRADRDPGVPLEPDSELDDVRRLVGDERGRTDRPEELRALEHCAGGVRPGHDLLVMR